MNIDSPRFNFIPTGIGSLPHKDPVRACKLVLENLPEIPFWPQLPRRDFNEGMAAQFSENMPGLVLDRDKKRIYFDLSRDFQKDLETFYNKYLQKEVDYFRISQDFAPGLYEVIKQIQTRKENPLFIKGQITGPITWGLAVTDENNRAIIHNEVIADVVVKGLTMKALWQVKTFTDSLSLKSIIFIDEPSLTGYGSAYVPLNRDTVLKYLNEVIKAIHSVNALVGIHCCGNTDWGMLLETPIDIISFDAYGFIDRFALYPKQIQAFLSRGGVIAWGMIPSGEVEEEITVEGMLKRLRAGIDLLAKKGLDKDLLLTRSLLTPSCGLGTRTDPEAERLIQLVSKTVGRITLIPPSQ